MILSFIEYPATEKNPNPGRTYAADISEIECRQSNKKVERFIRIDPIYDDSGERRRRDL